MTMQEETKKEEIKKEEKKPESNNNTKTEIKSSPPSGSQVKTPQRKEIVHNINHIHYNSPQVILFDNYLHNFFCAATNNSAEINSWF